MEIFIHTYIIKKFDFFFMFSYSYFISIIKFTPSDMIFLATPLVRGVKSLKKKRLAIVHVN